jgi:hypothetical protein
MQFSPLMARDSVRTQRTISKVLLGSLLLRLRFSPFIVVGCPFIVIGLHQGYKFGLTIKKVSQNIDLLIHRLLERADHDALSRQEREMFGPRHSNVDKYLKTRLSRAKAIFAQDHIERLVEGGDEEVVRVRSDHDDNRTLPCNVKRHRHVGRRSC